MLTSSTGMRVRISSTTRPSMPSYRPQAKMSRDSAAYPAAMSWLHGTGLGSTGLRSTGLRSTGLRSTRLRTVAPGNLVQGVAPDVRLHHHSRTAAERHVIDRPVNIRRPAPQVVH